MRRIPPCAPRMHDVLYEARLARALLPPGTRVSGKAPQASVRERVRKRRTSPILLTCVRNADEDGDPFRNRGSLETFRSASAVAVLQEALG